MMLSLNLSTVSLDFVLFLVFHGHLKIKMGSQVTIIDMLDSWQLL